MKCDLLKEVNRREAIKFYFRAIMAIPLLVICLCTLFGIDALINNLLNAQ